MYNTLDVDEAYLSEANEEEEDAGAGYEGDDEAKQTIVSTPKIVLNYRSL